MKGMPDFEAEGLLKGVRGRAREARLELLQHLYRDGVPLEELRRAVAEERLAILPTERVLAQELRYTVDELAELAGVDADAFIAQRRAAGLPVPPRAERAYSDADVEAARRLATALVAGVSPEGLLEAARVFGEAAARAASAARLLAAESFARPGDTERDLGLRYAEVARTLEPQTVATLQYLYEAHMREQLRSDMIAVAEIAAGRIAGTRHVTVCFADLVGFTKLGEQLPPEELGTIAGRLASLAAEAVREPVRLIKTIGDAAMLVSPEAVPLLDTALELVEVADSESEGFLRLRCGVATGEALNRWGDWYGSPVNLASRVTAIAHPSSVLATEGVHEEASEKFAWSFAGNRRLKGVPNEIALFRCRRAARVDADATAA
jgi:adenylate cyclase